MVGRAHILHDLDLTAAGKNAQADGTAHRDDADRHQHQDHDLAHLGHGPLDLHKGLGHLNGGGNTVHTRDALEVLAHGLHLAQVCQRDTVVGLEGVIILKFVQQNGVIRHVPTVLVEHVLLGHVLHPAHARGGSDALPYRLDGGIIGFGVHIDHHFVLLAQIVHHAVHIDFRQRGKGVQGHTDAQGGDAGNGHGPVLAQVAHAAHHKETERRRLHHTSDTSISSSFGSTGGWGIMEPVGTSEMMCPPDRVTTRRSK